LRIHGDSAIVAATIAEVDVASGDEEWSESLSLHKFMTFGQHYRLW